MPDNRLNATRRTLNTTPLNTANTVNNSGNSVRGRLSSRVYSAADMAVANEVRTKLSSGGFDRNPAVKARVINLLATFDAARSNGGVPGVPDRGNIDRIMAEMRRLRSTPENRTATTGETGGTGSVIHTPDSGTTPTFEVNPVNNTQPPERIREVKVAWDYGDVTPDLGGFRLYHEGEMVCEFSSPGARSAACDVSLPEGAHTFTLTAFNRNGLESAHSNTAVINNVFPPADE